MTTDMEVQYIDPVPATNPQDLTGLGQLLGIAGFTTLEARALIADVQQCAAQSALGLAPRLLEKIRAIQEHRFRELHESIRLMPSMAGYVHRDTVLSLIQRIALLPPRS
jgi:hypothetical protein